MTAASRLARVFRTLVTALARGQWSRYTIFAGTNNAPEALVSLLGIIGVVPLQDGPAIEQFERAFAQATGARHAVSFAAGRMALYALLEALDIGPEDEVILPAFTCAVVPNAVLYRGARPVYVDINAQTFNIDVDQIEAKITSRTKAIIAQHTFGLVCEIDAINAIAKRHGLAVIEDSAHALGAKFKGRPAGSLATAAYFSTDHTKVISTGTGGMATTSDPALAERLVSIKGAAPFLDRSQLRLLLLALALEIAILHPKLCALGRYVHALLWRQGLGRGFFSDEEQTSIPRQYPYPARLGNTQARIGLNQLRRLDQNLAWRRQLAERFDAELGVYCRLLGGNYTDHAWLRYTFMVENRAAWKKFFEPILDMGVWFTSVAHGRDTDFHEIGYQAGSCPVAEHAARCCVNLPTHLRINRPEALASLLARTRSSACEDLRLAS